jgi:PAS domain S-box-containing protein
LDAHDDPPTFTASAVGLRRLPECLTEVHALAAGPSGPADPAAELAAIDELTQALVQAPQRVLDVLVDVARRVGGVPTAGVSLLEPRPSGDVFRWAAVAGEYAAFRDTELPAAQSPCGFVIERNVPLRAQAPERDFPVLEGASPKVHEALLVPFAVEGRPVGTVWLVHHDPDRDFDLEHVRLLRRLSRFASLGRQFNASLDALARRSREWRQTLDTAAVGLTRIDRALRYVSANPAYARIAGLPLAEIVGHSMDEVLGPAAVARLQPFIRRVLAGETVEYELELPWPVSSPRWIHGRYTPWIEPDGSVGGWVGSIEDVSARKRMETAVEASETRRSIALSAGRMAAWEYDVATGRNAWDGRLAELLGLSPERAGELSDHWLETVDPRDRPRVTAQFAATLADGVRFDTEFRVRRFDGAPVWFASAAGEVRDSAGRLTKLVGIVQDITDRKAADQALRDSEERLQIALEAARAGAFDWNVETGEVHWTEGHYRVVGLSPDAGPPSYALWRRYVHPDDLPRVEAALAESLRTGAPYRGDYRACGADGVERWIAAYGLPTRDEGGRVRMIGAVVDITDRKRSERELEAANTRLLEATRAADLGIHEYYPQTGRLVWDGRLRAWWGVPPGETVTYETFVSRLHPDDRAATQAAVDRSLDPAGSGRYEAEYRVLHPDGTLRWIRATGTTSFEDGRAVRLIGTVQDVSDERKLTAALRQADRQKDVFLAVLSHELRNPLAPVRTAARILARPELDAHQLRWVQGVVQRQTEHMACLLDDLLDVARITQGKLDLRRELVSIAGVVDVAVEAARPLLDRKQHRLTVTLPPDTPVVSGDPLRLAQVLSNLLTNAAKYTDPGGRIGIDVRTDGDRVTLEVADSGIGIPAAALATLFEMFAQAPDAHERAEGGLGVGLALVKGLVELHGGTIEARSDGEHRGSTFTIHLPRAEPARSADVADVGPAASGIPRRVLVVDDNRDAADSLAMLLALSGHEVRVAYDATGALAVGPEFRPDVAILDIGLPQMDGYALAGAVRAETWGVHTLLAAVTGWGQDQDRRRAAEAGFDVHLTKPVDPSRIESLLAAQAS